MQAKTRGVMHQVVEHTPRVLGLVAIGSQAALSLCNSESPEGINQGERVWWYTHTNPGGSRVQR